MSDEKETIKVSTPIIVDMGRCRSSKIRAFKKGEGSLYTEISEVIDEVADQVQEEGKDQVFVPVIVIYERS